MCGHHRQRLEGEVLPCAVPGCSDGLPGPDELVLNSKAGVRRYQREATNVVFPGNHYRTFWAWREVPL